ncbi:GNAT family N-acetyltransferase [Eubacteriales bacterium OttesenSCG-928-N14]|nr:GNAT family N-acetyltransferase [Eubacteriales bacterium OttesenSCG-928-N14]
MITLRRVDESNYRQIIDLKLPDQPGLVAPNIFSLAQAWVFSEYAHPFGIYNDEDLVGFLLLMYHPKKKEASIWRMMIAQQHQGKGYGTQAMKLAIDLVQKDGRFDAIYLDYVVGNERAKHLYEKMGFRETGEIEDDEVIMKLQLQPEVRICEVLIDSVELRRIDADNYLDILQLEQRALPDDAKAMIPVLAQAWVHSERAQPFAIYDSTTLVGLIMLDYDFARREAGIWRLVIGEEHQNKGYGSAALQLVINLLRTDNRFDCITLDFASTNVHAAHVYEKLGFTQYGTDSEGSILMRLEL